MSPSRMLLVVSRRLSGLFIVALVQANILFAQSEQPLRDPGFAPPPDDWREIAEEVANSPDGQADPDNQGFAGAVLELMSSGPQLSGFSERSKLVELNKRIVESNSRNDWQETISEEGNYRIELPGAGKCSTIYQPTPFGPSRLYQCEYTITSANKEFVTSIRVCSAREPAKFLTKYTEQERIALINKMFQKHHQSQLPDYEHTVQTTTDQILGRPTKRIRETARRGDEWSINHSAMVYVDDIRYHIQVAQHGKGAGALFSEDDIGKIFSSFQLLKETQPDSAGSQNEANLPGNNQPDTGTVPTGFIDLLADGSLSGWRGVIRDPVSELEVAQADSDELMHQYWRVDRGVLTYDGPNKGVNMGTRQLYRNFELMVDWKIEPDGDSGIYLRGFPQVQIWDTQSAGLQRHGSALGSGGLWSNRTNSRFPLLVADKTAGSWNHFHIKMVNSRVSVELNGQMVVDAVTMENYWNAGQPVDSVGPIELQSYYGQVSFRNLFLRELPATADELVSQHSAEVNLQSERQLETGFNRNTQSRIGPNFRQHRDRRSPYDFQMQQLRQAFEAPAKGHSFDNRFSGPGWDEDARYREYQ